MFLFTVLQALAVNAQPLPTDVPFDPRATYYRTINDPAINAVPIDLTALGILPGDLLRLTAIGYFENGIGNLSGGMFGVFSSNAVLQAQDLTNRVPGAIPAGTPVTSWLTYYGNLSTDIPQDFYIFRTNISVHVPAGAAFLFVSAADSYFGDNTSYTSDPFRVRIERGTETLLDIANLPDTDVSVTWNTDSNQWYQVQCTPALSSVWTNWGPWMAGKGTRTGITNSTGGKSGLFYRVKRVP